MTSFNASLLPSESSPKEVDFNPRNINNHYEDLIKEIPKNEEILLNGYSYTSLGRTNSYSFTVEGKSDLTVYCHVVGPADKLNIYDPSGKLTLSTSHIFPDKPIKIKNAEAGEWTVELIPFGGIQPDEIIPFALAVTATPLMSELEIPKIVNSKKLIVRGSIDGGLMIYISVNDESVQPVQGENGVFKAELELEEGKNTITVESTNGSANSPKCKYEVFVDTDSPEIIMNNIKEEQIVVNTESFKLQGYVSRDTAIVMINGEIVSTDDWKYRFGRVYSLKQGLNEFEIKAVDYVGNVSIKVIKVVRQ